MKKWEVTLNIGHESYGGYDHKDGDETHLVDALNRTSAVKKAKKRHFKEARGLAS